MKKLLLNSRRIGWLSRLSTVPVQLCPSPVYPGLHVQYLYKEKKKREKNEKWECVFIQESRVKEKKKAEKLVCNFLVSCGSQVGPLGQPVIF